MRKAVFFDIDGTLWDWNMQVPKSTITAIHRLRENGTYAFICSGRSRGAIRAKELLEDIGFDGIVAGCGTHIEYQGELIFEKNLSQEEITFLLECFQTYNTPAILEGKRYLYADRETFGGDPYIEYLENILGNGFLTIKDHKGNYEANKVSIDITKGDVEGIQNALSKRYELICHGIKVMEIVPKGFSKASGIRQVCGYLNIPREHTYAFGDGENDIEMLRYANYGIAMGNATKEAKAAADYVTTDIKEDGIFNGLKHFELI
ncbi:MAG: Cof-type HAD-IIB family hydrolase [Lachnospiraceae bacterium]|nr:Cof-type HAD-IIB family hydrolase [Lachnospiraceae bacterium]